MRGLCPFKGDALRSRIAATVAADIEVVAAPELPAVPDVTVCVFSFNHGNYLRDAIDSILSQDFGGSLEILVADDCSTDGSREWLRTLQAEHPAKVRLLLARRNLWCEFFPGSAVAFPAYETASRSRYIALLEGDDFWTDPGKLRRQIDHLDAHADAAGCFTDCLLVDGDGRQIEPRPFWNQPYQNRYNRREALTGLKSGYATGALMFRGKVFREGIPEYFLRAGSDYLLDVAITGYGMLDYLPGVTSAYRIHAQGTWQGGSNVDQLVQLLVRLHALTDDPAFGSDHRKEISEMKRWCYGALLAVPVDPSLAKIEEALPVVCHRKIFDLVEGDWKELRDWRDRIATDASFRKELQLVVAGGDLVDQVSKNREGNVFVSELEVAPVSGDQASTDFEVLKESVLETVKALCETDLQLHDARKRIAYLESLLDSGWWRFGEKLRRAGILSRGYREEESP